MNIFCKNRTGEKDKECCCCGDYGYMTGYKGCWATLADLLKRYPDGGRSNWFAIIEDTGQLVYWSVRQNDWVSTGGDGEAYYEIHYDANGGEGAPPDITAKAGSLFVISDQTIPSN